MTTIRPVEAADIEQIVLLEPQIFESDAWSESMIRDELSANHRSYFVAVDGNSVVGYAGLLAVGAEGDVQTIALSKQYRGKGIGRELLNTLIDAARQRQARQLFLEVRADNANAIALYQSSGFEILGERPGYYQPGNVAAIVMRRNID